VRLLTRARTGTLSREHYIVKPLTRARTQKFNREHYICVHAVHLRLKKRFQLSVVSSQLFLATACVGFMGMARRLLKLEV